MRRLCVALCVSVSLSCTKEDLASPRDPVAPPPATQVPSASAAAIPAPPPAFETLLSTPEDELFPRRMSAQGPIVFSRESLSSQASNAAVFALDGPSARRLTRDGKFAGSPALSRDGATLVYVSNALGPLALLKTTVAPDGPTSVVISSDKAREPNEPALSPDGSTVAFSFAGPDGVRTIATVGVDGSKLSPHFPGRAPSFSPDGRALVFVAPMGGHNHVFVAELPSGDAPRTAPRALTNGDFDCDHPSFSPDGRHIVFSSNRGFAERAAPRETYLRIFVMNGDGSSAHAITPDTVRAATPSWGPDGRVYFAYSRGESFDLARVQPQ
jgi:TolB protein